MPPPHFLPCLSISYYSSVFLTMSPHFWPYTASLFMFDFWPPNCNFFYAPMSLLVTKINISSIHYPVFFFFQKITLKYCGRSIFCFKRSYRSYSARPQDCPQFGSDVLSLASFKSDFEGSKVYTFLKILKLDFNFTLTCLVELKFNKGEDKRAET